MYHFIIYSIRIDKLSRNHGTTVRNTIYKYLDEKLPHHKQTILSKIKKMRVQKEEQKAKEVQQKLKLAVDEVMPSMQRKHDLECKRVTELRNAAQATALSKGLEKPEQQHKMPRKKFAWNDSIRYE